MRMLSLRMRMRMLVRMFSSRCVCLCASYPDEGFGEDLEPGGGCVGSNVGQQVLKSLGA